MSLTCHHHRSASKLHAAKFWNTREGIFKRIDSLAQNFTFKVVNNAMKIVAPTNDVTWMFWEDYGDSAVCPECLEKSRGGSKDDPGYYRVTWFLPDMPVHPNCRCQWVLIYGPRVEQQRL